MSANHSATGRSLLAGCLIIAVAAGVAILTKEYWYSTVFPAKSVSILEKLEQHAKQQARDDGHHPGAHATGSVISLSAEGLKNIGFEPFVVKPSSYQRTLTLPAIVVERPGRSQLQIAAPLTGIVTKIHAFTGEAIESGQLMFEVRLTHEEIVAAQRDYLRTVENLDVVNREISRLSTLR